MVEARVDPKDVDAVARILAEVAGNPASIDRDTQRVWVQVGDKSLLRTASRRLDEAGVTVSELALRRPSLDEVFFALTGRPADEEPAVEFDMEGSNA